MEQASGAEYRAGWVAGWDAAMAHVHATVGAALGLNGRRAAPVDPSPEYGASCDLAGIPITATVVVRRRRRNWGMGKYRAAIVFGRRLPPQRHR